MTRMQKKCLIASAIAHGLLVLLLIVGPAFVGKKAPPDNPILEFLPNKAIEQMELGGGQPTPAPAPTKVEPPAPTPPTPAAKPVEVPPKPVAPTPKSVTPPPPKPPTVKHVVEQKPKVTELQKTTKTTEPVVRETPIKPLRNVDLTVKTRPSDAKAKAEQEKQDKAAAAERAAQLARLNSVVKSLGKNLSSGLKLEPVGPGAGGPSYANYDLIVKKIYDDAWQAPDDVSDDEATVRVSVTIASDGTVISASVVKKTGISALDKSVQRALDRVKTIGYPFPEGVREAERTYIINFNLKAKRLQG